MDTGIDDLDGKNLGDLRNARNALAGEIRSRALPAVLDAGDQGAACRFNPSDDAQELGLRWEEFFALARAKGAAVRQEVNRFEQARLAGTVLADDACRSRIEFETSRTDAAEVLDLDRGQHIGGGPAQSRIGMTTYFACGVELALTRQLLFASVSPSSTWPASIAASASSR